MIQLETKAPPVIARGERITDADGRTICFAARNISSCEPFVLDMFERWVGTAPKNGDPMPPSTSFPTAFGGYGLYVDGKPRPDPEGPRVREMRGLEASLIQERSLNLRVVFGAIATILVLLLLAIVI